MPRATALYSPAEAEPAPASIWPAPSGATMSAAERKLVTLRPGLHRGSSPSCPRCRSARRSCCWSPRPLLPARPRCRLVRESRKRQAQTRPGCSSAVPPVRSSLCTEFSRLIAAVATKGARTKGWRRLLQFRILACGIGPAQRGRQNDVHLAANRMAGMGAELDRLEPSAEHGELIDRLRALITAPGDAGGEPIVALGRAILAEPHVLRPHRDLDRFARLDARRHERREALAARVDGTEFAVAREHAAREQVRRPREVGDEQVGRAIVDLVR